MISCYSSFQPQAHTLIVSARGVPPRGDTAPMATVSDSPGPARYLLPNSVGGKQANAKMQDPPVWSFPKNKRAEAKVNTPSPGPVYMLDSKYFGSGPNGRGSEFGVQGSHRYPISERMTMFSNPPGPQYDIPTGLGKQVESTKRSFGAGKISQCPRKTMDAGPERSPGPAAYDRASIGCVTVARQKKDANLTTGMGAAPRFFDKETRTGSVPGPGAYKIPSCIGGTAPDLKMKPVFPFGKDEARHVHSMKTGAVDPCSPGPAAKYGLASGFGEQHLGARKSMPKYSFGTASRFPCSPEENRQHRVQVQRVTRATYEYM